MAELSREQVTSRLQDTFDSIAESTMEKDFHPVEGIYMDLSLLKDTRMGLMISLSDKSLKQYLLAGLDKYNDRLSRSFKEVYPDFPYTEEKLEEMWRDPNRSDEIFRYSPDTEMSLTLNKILEYILSHNSFVRYTGEVRLTINTYPLAITKHINIFERTLTELLKRTTVKVTFICTDPRYIMSSFWKKQGWLYIDDLSILSKDKIPFAEVLYRGDMPTATIVFPPCLTRDKRTAWIREGVDFSNTELVRYKLAMMSTLLTPLAHIEMCHVAIPNPNKINHK